MKASFRYLHEKKSSTLKSHTVTGHSVNRTYVLYNIVNSYLVWREHPWFSNIAAQNSMSCLWAYCHLDCIHIDCHVFFYLFIYLFIYLFFIFYFFIFLFFFIFFTEWMSSAGHNLSNDEAYWKTIGGGDTPSPPLESSLVPVIFEKKTLNLLMRGNYCIYILLWNAYIRYSESDHFGSSAVWNQLIFF